MTQRILCAPDSFKESLSAIEAARAMQRGIHSISSILETDLCPIADGGEGTVDAMREATGGQYRMNNVVGPLGQPIEAAWAMLPDHTAVVEMAAASGLTLVPRGQRDPTRTTTFGTGQLIRAALDAQATRIIVGIGGSATNDGGCGAAAALGVRFFDSSGVQLDPCMTGGLLPRIARIDVSGLDPRLQHTEFVVACDVTNPLTGPNGAAHIYGPQKGASPEQVEQLDAALIHLAHCFRTHLNRDVEYTPGAGAAGGLGAGMIALLGADLRPGVDLILDAVNFDHRVRDCVLCLTGEGRLDGQSLSGKACLGVARRAARLSVPTIAFVGSVGTNADATLQQGLTAYYPISTGLSLDESIRLAAQLLESATTRYVSQHLR